MTSFIIGIIVIAIFAFAIYKIVTRKKGISEVDYEALQALKDKAAEEKEAALAKFKK